MPQSQPDPETPSEAARPGRQAALPGETGRSPGRSPPLHLRPALSDNSVATLVIAALLSVLWLAMVGLAYLLLKSDVPNQSVSDFPRAMALLGVVMPVVLIWVAALAVRSARMLRQEAQRLQAAIEAMRHSHAAQQKAASLIIRPSPERRPEDLAPSHRSDASPTGTFTTRRDPNRIVASADGSVAMALLGVDPADDQPTLALGIPADTPGALVSVADYIQALNFPDGPGDHAGFRALRAALADRDTAKLIRAAQDVLTLLSQDGIYMDDLHPDRARPEFWRRFAAGERGRPLAPLGGVRDRSCLALTAGRMREDTIFRDAAHHFLRQFDRSFSSFEKSANDGDISALANTRTALVFMLLGRVTGIFG